MTSYWINLFTAETWAEASAASFAVAGFRTTRAAFAKKIVPGDVLLCYLGGGISRWVGALEAVSGPFVASEPRIWTSEPFPVRLKTKPIVMLTPETALPVAELAPQLSMFRHLANPRNYGWMFQGSPTKLQYQGDGHIILDALQRAEATPIKRPIIEKRRAPRKHAVLAAHEPSAEADADRPSNQHAPGDDRAHTEIQYLLLKLGNDLGLDVWVARNDRGRSWNGNRFQDIERLRQRLPEQFDPKTQGIVELIDVLWIEREGIRCAFEIENSTNIYGGILRMTDLLARRPNLEIPLYIVAPDDRFDKVVRELNRPTFTTMRKPVVDACKFIAYSDLRESIARWSDHLTYLRPDVIDGIAKQCRRPAAAS